MTKSLYNLTVKLQTAQLDASDNLFRITADLCSLDSTDTDLSLRDILLDVKAYAYLIAKKSSDASVKDIFPSKEERKLVKRHLKSTLEDWSGKAQPMGI